MPLAFGLGLLTRDHSLRPRTAGNAWRRKDCQIGVAAREWIHADAAISYCCEFTAQEIRWDTMLRRRPIGVENADARARLERRDEVVKQAIGLDDLVVHVDKNSNVDRVKRQSRIVRVTEALLRRFAIRDRAPDCASSANIRVPHLLQ